MKRYPVLLILIFIFTASSAYPATKSTSFRFSTIETTHFSVHYHQGLEETAQKVARIAERVYPVLSAQFRWEPREKTQIVVIDDSDFANGYASVLPYNTIYVKPIPPTIDMTIGEYEDWLEMLIVHEYAHILTMDASRGYSSVMRNIFGKPLPAGDILSFLTFIASVPPNVLMPRWWHEGAATWAETEFTEGGRGRSSYYEMILRMAVFEDNIPSIDQVNGEVPHWPSGHMPYIFGLRLQKYIADRYGREALGELNLKHAGRFPYLINGAPLRTFGSDYAGLYRQMVSDLKTKEMERIRELSRQPLTTVTDLPLDGEILSNPRFSPDGELLAVNRRDPHGHEEIVILSADGGREKGRVRRLPSDRSITWSPDSKMIYFTQAEVRDGFNIYQDLYSYDIYGDRVKRLTKGLRVRDADLSPDGKRFAVIVSGEGRQSLALLEIEGKDRKLTTLTGGTSDRLSSPRWSPDGSAIVYALKDNSGSGSIRLYEMSLKEDRLLSGGGHDYAHPTWSPDGGHIVHISDETGVYNLFSYSMGDGSRRQVTHLLGGAFQPDISKGGKIAFSLYNSRGFRIATVGLSAQGMPVGASPSITPYWKESLPQEELSTKDTDTSTIPSVPYSSISTLIPRFWLPTVSEDHKGPIVGAFTAGQDVIGYNTYILQAGVGVSSGRGYYSAEYLNDHFYPTFSLQGYEIPVFYSDLMPEGDYHEVNRGFLFTMTVPINRLESGYSFILGYHAQEQDELDLPDGAAVPFTGKRGNLFGGIEFSNALKYPYSTSHEEGRRARLLYKYYSGETGSDLDSEEYIAAYAEYLDLSVTPLRHDAVYLKLTGAAARGDRTVQQSFQIGGYPALDGFSGSNYPIRGYPSAFMTGQYLAVGTLEYRFPLTYIFSANGTRPFFFDRLHSAIFVDSGEVWDDDTGFKSGELRTGAGLELRLDMTIGYWLRLTPAIGVAHGFDEDGETSVYLTIYTNL